MRKLIRALFVCKPANARFWFKLRETVNWAIVIVVFIPFVFFLQTFLPYWAADTIAIAVIFPAFFFVLQKRAISIECPHCHRHLNTNTPWVCGFKFCRNENVDDFPFMSRCEHCGIEPKAYRCHYKDCGKPIFFTNDEQDAIHAAFINPSSNLPPLPPRPKSPSRWERKAAQESEQLHDLQHELKVTKLRGDISEAKARIQPEKSEKELLWENLQKYLDRSIGAEEAGRKMKAIIDIQYANDPAGRERAYAIIDAWVRERI